MSIICTDILSIAFPDSFISSEVYGQGVLGQYAADEGLVVLNIYPVDRPLLHRVETGQIENYRIFCSKVYGKLTWLEEKTLDLDGRAALLMTAEGVYGYVYLFAFIRLTDTICLFAGGYCPQDAPQDHLQAMEAAVRSLRIVASEPGRVMEQHLAALEQQAAEQEEAKQQEQALREQSASAAVDEAQVPVFEMPADGKSLLLIDGEAFDISDQSKTSIPLYGNQGMCFCADIVATPCRTLDLPPILDREGDGNVCIRFGASGIYQASGVPQGEFVFETEDDRDTTRHATIEHEGFRPSLKIAGRLTLQDGWLGFSGYFDDGYYHCRRNIHLLWKLPEASLCWERYLFRSMEELLRAPPELPRRLSLVDQPSSRLGDALWRYTRLESLYISYLESAGQEEDVEGIPEGIVQLTQLQRLEFNTARHFREIPSFLGQLRDLDDLRISGSQAVTVPVEVLTLPKLSYCALCRNRLTSLPEAFSPALRTLDLSGNQLETVPEAYATEPRLGLDLEKNPLVFLHEAFFEMPRLRIEPDKRRALFPAHYPFDARVPDRLASDLAGRLPLLAEHSPLRKPLLAALLPNEAVAPLVHAVAGTLRASVDFYHGAEEDYATLGNHRLGGLPDLPDGMPYPSVGVSEDTLLDDEDCWRDDEEGDEVCIFPWDAETQTYQVPLEFIAQLDCQALAPLQDYLPRTGTLFFFLACGSSPLATQGRVLYVEDRASLGSGQRFADLAFNEEKTLGQKPSFILHPRASVAVPSFYALGENPHLDVQLRAGMTPEQEQDWQTLASRGENRDALPRLGGTTCYAWQLRQLGAWGLQPGSQPSGAQRDWLIEKEILPVDCASDALVPEYQGIARVNGCGFSQHALPELQAAHRYGGDAQDWLVLFQVDLAGQFQWDDGTLNFIIHRDDLAARRFDRVFMVCDY
ncbi:MAG: DUF1963 domain-containing protein [Corticimicrobacter sp.]|uniref:DUF1963 domain-containing protein n=1 Tax=Corticimicrobacter sp. TaxID=2678536 RepID=UPI0032DB78F4